MFILDILAITFHPYYSGYYNGPKKSILTRFSCIIYTALCFSCKYTQELYFCLSAMLLKFHCAVCTDGESEVFGNIHTGYSVTLLAELNCRAPPHFLVIYLEQISSLFLLTLYCSWKVLLLLSLSMNFLHSYICFNKKRTSVFSVFITKCA